MSRQFRTVDYAATLAASVRLDECVPLADVQRLFVQVLLLPQGTGLLQLGNISLDGTKLHADASKSKAVSHRRLTELETRLRAEIAELFALAERTDQGRLPDGLVIADE